MRMLEDGPLSPAVGLKVNRPDASAGGRRMKVLNATFLIDYLNGVDATAPLRREQS